MGRDGHSELFQPDTRQVQVVADTNTPVEVLLEPLQEKVVKITGQKQLVTATQTDHREPRDQTFIQTFPTNVANPLSLGSLETANPGFVADSVNQVHPRGEHASTTIVHRWIRAPRREPGPHGAGDRAVGRAKRGYADRRLCAGVRRGNRRHLELELAFRLDKAHDGCHLSGGTDASAFNQNWQ